MEIDVSKAQRETLRWHILFALEKAQEIGLNESLLFSIISDIRLPATEHEVRRALDYLSERELIKLDKGGPVWYSKLTRFGMDVAQYTVDCEPGIARPQKYW